MAKGETTLLELEYIFQVCSQILLPAGLVAISKICQFLTRTSPLNCLPSPDYFPVELH